MTTADRNRNRRDSWKKRAAARIDPPVSFHTLRHTYASLAIMAGAPSFVVAKNLGHSDTRMVEKHYGHHTASYIADAIRAAAPRFGTMQEDDNVTPIARGGGAYEAV